MTTRQALIVDDSATARHVLGRMLKQLDFSIIQASSGQDALKMLRTETPDIIFLDHIMPGMDGFQVLKEIKSNTNTDYIPVVMYTSQAAAKYKEEAKALGAAGVISKQVENDTLYSLVESILESRVDAHANVIELAGNGDLQMTSSRAYNTSSYRASSVKNNDEISTQRIESLLQDIKQEVTDIQPTLQKHFLRKHPFRSALLGLLLLIPIIMVIELSNRVNNQQLALAQIMVQTQAFQIENTKLSERLLLEMDTEREKLNEERMLVNELIVTLAQQIAAAEMAQAPAEISTKEGEEKSPENTDEEATAEATTEAETPAEEEATTAE